jgi:hypothetical protein
VYHREGDIIFCKDLFVICVSLQASIEKFMWDKQSKKFFLMALLFLVVSFLFGLTRFIIFEDFPVQAKGFCDPAEEVCFMHVCDPENEECAGDIATDTTYYAKLYKTAKKYPHCGLFDTKPCPKATCEAGEKKCTELPCTQEVADEFGDICSTPKEYQTQREALAGEATGNARTTDANDASTSDTAAQEVSSTENTTQK